MGFCGKHRETPNLLKKGLFRIKIDFLYTSKNMITSWLDLAKMRSFRINLSSLGVVEEIDLDKVKEPRFLLRSALYGLEELKLSIKKNGLLLPLIVRPSGRGGYELAAGYRRFQACRSLGLRKVLCHVLALNDREAFEISLIENVQRETLSPLEEANAFKQYVEEYGSGSISALAVKIGKSATYVSRRIKLLSLPLELQQEILRQRKNLSIASEMLAVDDDDLLKELSNFVFQNQLSEKETRVFIKNIKSEFHVVKHRKLKLENLYHDSELKVKENMLKKFLTVLQIALVRVDDILNEYDNLENWEFREVMLNRRYALHQLIDSLIVIQNKSCKMTRQSCC